MPEPANLKVILENLNDIVLDLVDERDKSAATEAALIQTLTESSARLRDKIRASLYRRANKDWASTRDLLASLQAQMKKMNP